MFRSGLLFTFLYLFCGTVYSSSAIKFIGSEMNVALDNTLELTPTDNPFVWENQHNFIKLHYKEHNIGLTTLRYQLKNATISQANKVLLKVYRTLESNDGLFLLKELISGNQFLQVIKIAGNTSSSYELKASLPLPISDQQIVAVENMLKNHERHVTSDSTLYNTETVTVSNIPGFNITKKFSNSIVLRSSRINGPVNDAILIISLVDQTVSPETIEEATLTILRSSKSLSDVQISNVKSVNNKVGTMALVKASGIMGDDKTPIDLFNISQKIGSSLLFVQLATPSQAESFLKLEDLSRNILQHVSHVKSAPKVSDS